ncbi:hypothetical protein KEJ37_07905 [Candidatus Bathyarchaeota archaeon]|nr:hypothetical protein [Candidatus Bathyarchaeota archaeon]
MGFSVTITSSIILIVLLALSSTFLITIFQGLKEILYIADEYVNRGREKIDVALQLEVHPINATSLNITIKNIGSRVVFFKSQSGYKWNTIILSYGNSSFWTSYPIENYDILEVRVSGTNYIFTPDNHSYIDAGEEALVFLSIPSGAPEIPLNGLVSVVFVTHYGVTAKGEAVRTQ